MELGSSVAEVARACEVNPNVLHRGRRELREYGANASAGTGAWRKDASPTWNVKSAAARWRSIILGRCLQLIEEQRKRSFRPG